jgi:hypothetical protein
MTGAEKDLVRGINDILQASSVGNEKNRQRCLLGEIGRLTP